MRLTLKYLSVDSSLGPEMMSGSARLVDQDGIHFVDDGVLMAALDTVFQAELHVVAQVIEAELVVGAVGDVGVVVVLPYPVVFEVVDDDADGEAEGAVDLAHPFGVAVGQVIVDGDDVDAFAFERVEVRGQGGDQGLPFPGPHFGDLAAMQNDAADQLHVEVAHVKEAAAGFAHGGEGFDEQVVEGGALGQFFLEFDSFGGEIDIGELLEGGGQLVDGVDEGLNGLDFAFVFGAKDLGQDDINHREVSLQRSAVYMIARVSDGGKCSTGGRPKKRGMTALFARPYMQCICNALLLLRYCCCGIA